MWVERPRDSAEPWEPERSGPRGEGLGDPTRGRATVLSLICLLVCWNLCFPTWFETTAVGGKKGLQSCGPSSTDYPQAMPGGGGFFPAIIAFPIKRN